MNVAIVHSGSKLLPLLVGVLLVSGCFRSHRARLTLSNRSDERLTSIEITVAGERFQFAQLVPAKTQSVSLTQYSDSDWTVDGHWADGSPFHLQFGYITHGMDFDDSLEFRAGRNVLYNGNEIFPERSTPPEQPSVDRQSR